MSTVADASSPSHKDLWDKLEVAGKIIVPVVVAFLVAWVGNTYTAATKEREIAAHAAEAQATLNARFAETALQILAHPSKATDLPSPEVKGWAACWVERYTGIVVESCMRNLDGSRRVASP